jgi:hypothetical protein
MAWEQELEAEQQERQVQIERAQVYVSGLLGLQPLYLLLMFNVHRMVYAAAARFGNAPAQDVFRRFQPDVGFVAGGAV